MADTKRRETPDILGSLLGGDPEPRETTPSRPAEKPEGHNAGIPVSHKAKKPVKKTTPLPPPAPVKEEEAPGDKAKATYYLSTEILESIEEAWIQLRRMAPKDERGQISKSLIVELAVQIALDELKSKGEKSLLARKIRKE